jgi:RimJ/RimL family protein N-acetyltransferase
MQMIVIETERLQLRHLTTDDAEFMLELLNDRTWIANIGDRGIRTLQASADYIERGYAASYEVNGYGLYAVILKETGGPIGVCGLIKRPSLPAPDIGFAFFERMHGKGYGRESAFAALSHGLHVLNIPRIVAITNEDNAPSAGVLEAIGMKFEKMIKLPEVEREQRLFSIGEQLQ